MKIPKATGIVINSKGVLFKDGAPYRGIGINYFSAFSRHLLDPTDTSYREGFAELSRRGIPFIRFMAGGFWPNDWKRYQEDREGYFHLLDEVVQAAEENGLGLIPSLFWYPSTVPDLVGEPRSAWGDPKSKTQAFMRQYVQEVVTRYYRSPAIWAWEFGNEFNLDADLPNAEEHRPWVVPERGTPNERSAADDVTHDMVVTAYREFGKAVRRFDPFRPISSGASLPRPTAQHLRMEKSWVADSQEQFAQNLKDLTPTPVNLVSVHLYPFDRTNRFDQADTAYCSLISLCTDAMNGQGKAVFVGEFGAPDDEKRGGPDLARRQLFELLSALETSAIPLAAVWVYDLPDQESFINITPTNSRSYILDAVADANRRIQLYAEAGHRVVLQDGSWSGWLVDNNVNRYREGAGFSPLQHTRFPGQNLFRNEYVGLNFEHIFNGRKDDRGISKFTPRKDPCLLIPYTASSSSVHFPASESTWGMDAEMRYTLASPTALDMQFSARLTRDVPNLGYLALMWASYMNHTRERSIHFYGLDNGEEGWLSFGGDTPQGMETGTVACADVLPLPYEPGAETLNLIESRTKQFLLPFYYGLVDGDGNTATTGDTMVYIMMFDQRDVIRFALWNYIKNSAGEPDPHSPAWDWQYVIRNPQVGTTYGYRARLVYKPFVSLQDVRQEYLSWTTALKVQG